MSEDKEPNYDIEPVSGASESVSEGAAVTQSEAPAAAAPATDGRPKKTDISSLLPPAEVQFFTKDPRTIEVVDKIKRDWRFARIKMEHMGETLDHALEHYSGSPSPDLIIIQADRTDEVLEKGLESLSQYCEEGTAAIIIGPVNDVQLYRNLMSMGISDYLVAPVPLGDLISAIGHVLLDLKGTLGSQLVSVIGTKGGVGTSTMAQIISYSLSENLKQKTLLMDAAAGHSCLWSLFDFKPSRTVIEAAKAAVDRDHEELAQIMVEASDNLSVLNSGAERLLDNPAALQAFNMLLDRMLYLFPCVVIDLSFSPKLLQREILSRSESIFITTTPTLTSLSFARGLTKEIEDLRGGERAPITMINNKIGQSPSAEVPEKDIQDMLTLPQDRMMSVPFDPKFFLGLESEGTDIETTKQGQKYMELAAPILENDLGITVKSSGASSKESSGGLGGILGLLKGKGH